MANARASVARSFCLPCLAEKGVTGIPKSLKRRIRWLANFPRYGPIGMHDPQQEVSVWLHGLDEKVDVTCNNVVAALRPFTIGVMVSCNQPDDWKDRSLRLCLHERGGTDRLLGVIHLRFVHSILLPGHRLCLFETPRFENFCVDAVKLQLYDLYEQWRVGRRQRRNPHNFLMTTEDILCSHVFYICPRPVVLVTVEHEGEGNMFPMDLIGPTDSPWYTMALRSTSPAVRLMQESRRMALASIPFSLKAATYEMGKHHKNTSIDWASLPFPTMMSPSFGLHVPVGALRIREVRVAESHAVGSHILFITSIEHETLAPPDSDVQLFHSFTSYRHYLLHKEATRKENPTRPF
jgi:flavin reductase (DIM6/NTAB) family NADH-FMN oxidoreductase RutF